METQTATRRPTRISAYDAWRKAEGVPIHEGSFVSDLATAEVSPWARVGQKGAFVCLGGQEEDDGFVIEIDAGGQTKVMHHMFETTIIVVNGQGATTFWQKDRPKQTVEWTRGSMFSPPLNCYYQHFNLDGQKPARLFAVSNCPMVMNLFRSPEYVFGDDFVFADRYDAEDTYFTDAGQHLSIRQWTTNFVPDIRTFKLDDYHERGAGGTNMRIRMANNQTEGHISEFPPGTYKKGHRHGVGAYVIILNGVGYSLLWFKGEKPRKVDWKDGAAISPRDNEYHQHFNTGPDRARYLALRLGNLDRSGNNESADDSGLPLSTISERDGGRQVDYEDEDPAIFELYAAECAKNGATVTLPKPVYRK